MLDFRQITAFVENTIKYRWMTVIIVATLVVVIILLVGCGRNEMPQTASSIPALSPVAKDMTQNPEPTKEGTPTPPQEEPTSSSRQGATVGEWDVVVLGRVDFCEVCQRGSPNVSYTKVLAGKLPNGQTEGTLAVAGVAAHLLPEGGVPKYESQQEEIVFLKRVTDRDLYSVVDVMKATPENLALFPSQ